MHYLTYIFLFTFVYKCSAINLTKNLTKNQWVSINKIIQHPNTDIITRQKINKLLFFYYNDWSWSKAYKFKQQHYYKCQHIPLNELSMYSSIGLLRSIQKYKGTSEFSQYATFYIDGELYNAITNLHPITSVSKNLRKKRKKIFVKNPEVLILRNNDWLLKDLSIKRFEQEMENKENHYYYKEIWNKIDQLDSFTKQILYYKFNFYFDKIRTNIEIAELLCVSDEMIRKTLVNLKL